MSNKALPQTLAEAIEQQRGGDGDGTPWSDDDVLMFKWGCWVFAQIMNSCYKEQDAQRLSNLLQEALDFVEDFQDE
jgi:hypothetical protein